MDNRQQGGPNTSNDISAKFFDCELNVNPGLTSAQLLATIKHHVSLTLDDRGLVECTRRRIRTASSS